MVEVNGVDSERYAELVSAAKEYIYEHKGLMLRFPIIRLSGESVTMNDIKNSNLVSSVQNIDEYLSKYGDNGTFDAVISELLKKYGLTAGKVCRLAGLPKGESSRLTKKSYMPTRAAVNSLVLAMRLSIADAERLLVSAGYIFSENSIQDLVIMFCLDSGIYDIALANRLIRDMYMYKV